MDVLVDLHVHTNRHSVCSAIDPAKLLGHAAAAGIGVVVITEHHYQWPDSELDALRKTSPAGGVLLLAGFEYTSARGDILIYGLPADQAAQFQPGQPPEDMVELAHGLGGVCIAAHPTRMGMGFDERIYEIPFDAVEVQSVNLKEPEQHAAAQVARRAGLRPIAASDAHQLTSVGRYATLFEGPIGSMDELRVALQRGRFRPAGRGLRRTGTA
jgi:hypothetical protein